MRKKPIASLSLDLDNKWSYMKTHGDPGWESFPSYLDLLVPRILTFLKHRNLTITAFIVGQDAALEKNREAIASIAHAGHEIGNHSFHHEPWLHLHSAQEIDRELADAEDSIEKATQQRPRGFRGPGFIHSPTILRVLSRRGYLYDASTLPTFIGPLARLYYFKKARLETDEKLLRKQLFGSYKEAFRPIKPYLWEIDGAILPEIPVTTMPIIRLPIHLSYILYLSSFSWALALLYFNTAMALCRLTQTPPSVLLHALDFLGCDDVSDLAFFPAMKLPRERKCEMIHRVIDLLQGRFNVLTLREHAAWTSDTKRISPVKIHLG